MIIEVRKMLVWATAAAAIVSAVMLAIGDAGLPRFDAPGQSGSAGAGAATAAR